LLLKKSWLTLLLWYYYVFEYGGAFIDLAAMFAFPFLFWFLPNRIFFVLSLLFFTPFYPILRLINILARLTSSIKYVLGDQGNWQKAKVY
jgi:hypothetical protein